MNETNDDLRSELRRLELNTILNGLTLDLHEMSVHVWASRMTREAVGVTTLTTLEQAWVAMTGLDNDTALDLASHIVTHTDAATAAVVPF